MPGPEEVGKEEGEKETKESAWREVETRHHKHHKEKQSLQGEEPTASGR